jgi:hypothetical protein
LIDQPLFRIQSRLRGKRIIHMIQSNQLFK